MNKFNIRRKIVSFVLAGSLIACPINGICGSIDNVVYEDESKYADWFLYNSKCDYLDELWNEVNKYDFIIDAITKLRFKVVLIEKEGILEKYFNNNIDKSNSHLKGLTYTPVRTIFCESFKRNGMVSRAKEKSNNKALFKGVTNEELSYRFVRDTLFHEIGHLLDCGAYYLAGYVDYGYMLSLTSEFKSVYEEEVNNFKNTIEFIVDNCGEKTNISNNFEYFASSFACYMFYPDDLKEKCPKTFEIMDNYIKTLMGEKTKK